MMESIYTSKLALSSPLHRVETMCKISILGVSPTEVQSWKKILRRILRSKVRAIISRSSPSDRIYSSLTNLPSDLGLNLYKHR